MFYSHEVLTSRKYGVATIWLVATLGAKSSTKKVTRKAILEVDVPKACQTFGEPKVPLALRLQGNLLYGVSRVHSQQWGYLLTDAQAAQTCMRNLIKIIRTNALDPNAGKARPEQLVLMDDPNFLPDMPLPPLEFDFSNLEFDPRGDSQHSSQSMMSIRQRSGSALSHTGSAFGFNMPSSSHGGAGSYQLPLNDPLGEPKIFGAGPFFDDDEAMILEDDDLFDFDADGQLRDIPAAEREARRAASVHPQGRLGSDSAASGRVRKEHEDGFAGRGIQTTDREAQMFNFDDDLQILPDAEPFPVMTGALGAGDKAMHLDVEDRVFSDTEPSTVSAEAPQKKTKAKGKRNMIMDSELEIQYATLSSWQREYVDKMAATTRLKTNHRAAAQAKKNAFHFVYGAGFNGVGQGVGSSKLVSPLAMFSGELLSKLIGQASSSTTKPKGTKRSHAVEEPEEQPESPTKRVRGDEIGRGYEDDGMVLNLDDQYQLAHEQSIELGRDAPSALPDNPSSAMPWNVSASLHSHQRGQSSSIPGRSISQLGSVLGRRLTSASPLVGRGLTFPGNLEQFSQIMADGEDMVLYGRSDDISQPNFGLGGSDGLPSGHTAGPEFEIFGPAAGVDTQTAGSSQWMREAMDRESNNFLEYVKNSITEKMGDDLEDDPLAQELKGERCVGFEELFRPEENTVMVAAQAFYHVLCLATRGAVWVEQEAENWEPWGEIVIGVA